MKIIRTVLFTIVTLIAIAGTYFIIQLNSLSTENNRKAMEKETTLSSKGVKSMAKVANYKMIVGNDRKPSKDESGNQRYEIDYQFEVKGSKYSGKTFVGRQKPTEPIEIVYDPESPETNLYAAQEPTQKGSITGLLIVYAVFSIFILCFFSEVNRRLK